jgi:pilus retraction protein PilT
MAHYFAEFEKLLLQMEASCASDLFLSVGCPPRQRVNGFLVQLEQGAVEHGLLQAVLEQVLRPVQLEAFQRDGDIDFGLSLSCGKRFRLNAHLQRGVLGIVARSIPTGQMQFAALGLPSELVSLAACPRGLLLVTGATGSGKSTTLAALVHHINVNEAKHIVTIEDPVEYIHENLRSLVTQREVGSDTRDFASALRHVLRESPDVIVIGEMRDAETAQVALSAAMTGHLVIASLHTMDAVQTLQRVMSFFPEHQRQQVRFDLAFCLEGIVAQRLVPRADGAGRVVAVEVLTASAAVRKLLREGQIDEIPELMIQGPGMRTFNKALLELFNSQRITIEAGAAYAPNPEEFRMNASGVQRGGFVALNEFEAPVFPGGLDMRSLLHSAARHGASDIHLAAGAPPVFRIHGELRPLVTESLTPNEVRRLLFSMLSHSQREEFELEKELDFAISLSSGTRFRVNAHFQRNTMAVAMRMIPGTVPPIESLGLPAAVTNFAEARQGLVLVTGPTGSGKSTTLATLVDLINQHRSCRIITVEDPVEFVHHNRLATIEQREVGPDTKSFAAALKYVLRQDPDVILVGEMRDLETIQAALTAAETGHLVFATLHTNDAPQAIDRIIDVFPSHQQEQVRGQIASALLGVVSQRLLRKSDGQGRVAAFEVLLASNAVRTMVREGKTHQLLGAMEIAVREGMQTLDRAVEHLLHEGVITREEAVRYLRSPALLNKAVPSLPESMPVAAPPLLPRA